MRSPRPTRALLVAIAAIGLSGCGLQEDIAQRPDSGGTSAASPISAATLTGSHFDWSATRGHVVVLDFWAAWCGPCRAEQDSLNHLAATYTPRGVVFLGVDMRDDNANADAFRRDYAVQYPSVIDPDETVAAAYNVPAPPVVIVIDAQGRIIDRFGGTIVGVSDDLNRLSHG
jgi:cytochrome c biogenesis protein CcmG, thiol:disulfide interchange protein DsbE